MNHYFIYNENLKKEDINIQFSFKDVEFKLSSDKNVFSKKRLDKGSEILIKTLLNQDLTDNFLDLGCGYGCIGIVIKYFNKDLEVVCSDINQKCIDLTAQNIKNNNLNIKTVLSDSFNNIEEKFQTIAFNAPISVGKEKIYSIYKDINKHLKSDGSFYLVIRKDKGAFSHQKYLSSLFSKVSVIYKEKGYLIVKAK